MPDLLDSLQERFSAMPTITERERVDSEVNERLSSETLLPLVARMTNPEVARRHFERPHRDAMAGEFLSEQSLNNQRLRAYGNDVDADWANVAETLQRNYGVEEPERFRTPYIQARRVGERLQRYERIREEVRGPAADELARQRAIGFVPIARPVYQTGVDLQLRSALERIRRGEETDGDWAEVANAEVVAQMRGDSDFGGQLLDTLGSAISFGGELALSGGALTSARMAAQAGIRGIIGRTLARSALPFAAQGVANTARNLVPEMTRTRRTDLPGAPTELGVAEGRPLGTAALRGFGESAIDVATEYAGEGLRFVPGLRRLAPAPGSLLARGGFSGVVGEMIEERIADLAHGVATTHPDYGMFSQVARGEMSAALRQLGVEGTAFGLIGLGGPARRVMNRVLGRTLPEGGPAFVAPPTFEAFQQTQEAASLPPDQQAPYYQAVVAQVEQQNEAAVQQWLTTTPVDELSKWVGHQVGDYRIDQDLINRRLAHDRAQEDSAQQNAIATGDAEFRSRAAAFEAELAREAAKFHQGFRQDLNKVRDQILGEARASAPALPTEQPLIGPRDLFIDPKRFFGESHQLRSDMGVGSPAGMELARGGGQIQTVPLRGLIPTQEYIGSEAVKNAADTEEVQLVRIGGRYYIYDGHHRAAGAVLRGKTSIQARVVDADTLGQPPSQITPADQISQEPPGQPQTAEVADTPIGAPATRPEAQEAASLREPAGAQASTPPKTGFVPATKGPDGRVYYGRPGETHYDIQARHPELVAYQGVEADFGFAGPDGRFLTREEAYALMERQVQAVPEQYRMSSPEKGLYADDLTPGAQSLVSEELPGYNDADYNGPYAAANADYEQEVLEKLQERFANLVSLAEKNRLPTEKLKAEYAKHLAEIGPERTLAWVESGIRQMNERFPPKIGSPSAPEAKIGAPKRVVVEPPKPTERQLLQEGKKAAQTLREWVIAKGGIRLADIEATLGVSPKEAGLLNITGTQSLDLLAKSLSQEKWRPATEGNEQDYRQWLLDKLIDAPTMTREGMTQAQGEKEQRRAERESRRPKDKKKAEAFDEYQRQLRLAQAELDAARAAARNAGESEADIAASEASGAASGTIEGQAEGLNTSEGESAGEPSVADLIGDETSFDPAEFDTPAPSPATATGAAADPVVKIGAPQRGPSKQDIKDILAMSEQNGGVASHEVVDASHVKVLYDDGVVEHWIKYSGGWQSYLADTLPEEFREPSARPAPSAARITPKIGAPTETPSPYSPDVLESNPLFEELYEGLADVFDPKPGVTFDHDQLVDSLRILDTWAALQPKTLNAAISRYAAEQILKDYAVQVEKLRGDLHARTAKVKPIKDFDADRLAQLIWDGESTEGANQLTFEVAAQSLTPEQLQALDDAISRISQAEASRVQAEADPTREWDPGGTNVEQRKPRGRLGALRSTGAPALPSAPNLNRPISPFQIIANLSRLFNLPYYNHRLDKLTAAVYLVRPRAVMMHGMHMGNAPVFMHEVAHDISKRLNLFPDTPYVRGLPVQVQQGLTEFDYDPRNHDLVTSAEEGFAEYLRMITTGTLPPSLTQAQAAAAAWLNSRIQSDPGMVDKLRQAREFFNRFRSMSAERQAASLVSASGKPAKPELPWKQEMSEDANRLWVETRKALENDQIAISLFEQDAMKKGRAFTIRPSEVFFHVRNAAPHWAADMFENGVFGYRFGPDGQVVEKVRLGAAWNEIISTLHKDTDLAPYGPGEVTRFETYFLAKHIEAEEAEGRPNVGEASREYYMRALESMRQDAAFIQRAEPAAQKLTAAYNATLDARALAQMITPEQAARLKERRPTYADLTRVPEVNAWTRIKNYVAGRREALDPGIKARSGSDLPILAPFKSYMNRLRLLSSMLAAQSERQMIAGTIKNPGEALGGRLKTENMGNWLIEVEQPQEKLSTLVYPEQLRELMEQAGIPADVMGLLDELELTAPELTYFKPSAVPINGKPTIVVLEQGQPHFYRVNDKGLYDLVVGPRTLPEPGPLNIIRWANKLIKAGATTFSHLFQMANVPRDALTFTRNTINLASIKDIPKMLGSLNGYMRAKMMGWTDKELATKMPWFGQNNNPWIALYMQHAGEWTRMLNISEPGIEKQYREITSQHGITKIVDVITHKVGDFLRMMGSSEHAPRGVEMRTRLQQQGVDTAEVERYLAGETNAIEEYKIISAMVAAAEVTTPFNRLGWMSRWLNLYIPFFGPSLSGLSKSVRGIAQNPGRVAAISAAYMALEVLHWLMNKDEEWYQNLPPHLRSRWWTVQIGGTLWRIPKARDPEVAVVNGFGEYLRMISQSNPNFAGWMEQTWSDHAPPILPAGFATAWQLRGNRDWKGAPIVPRGAEDLPESEQLGYQLRYAADQMTGGLLSGNRLRPHPFEVTGTPSQSMQDFYSQFDALERQRTSFGRANRVDGRNNYAGFPQEAEYDRLAHYRDLLRTFNQAANGLSGDERRQVAEARRSVTSALMGLRGSEMPRLSSLPSQVRGGVEQWLGQHLEQMTNDPTPQVDPAPRVMPTGRRETPAEVQARVARSRAERQAQIENARRILADWRLPVDEQERLLRQHHQRSGQPLRGRLGVLRR